MKKSGIWIAAVVVLIILAAVIYAVHHKSNKTTNTSTSSSSSSSVTVNNAVIITKSSASLGNYLADPNSITLYTIGSGSAGVTACSGSCLSAWPPYKDTGSTTGLPTNIGTITRADNGVVQYTYKGMPLYYFASDSAGQVTGNGVSGFYVAKP